MKRRDLENRLRHSGCYLKREGASHSLWTNPRTAPSKQFPDTRKSKSRLPGKS